MGGVGGSGALRKKVGNPCHIRQGWDSVVREMLKNGFPLTTERQMAAILGCARGNDHDTPRKGPVYSFKFCGSNRCIQPHTRILMDNS